MLAKNHKCPLEGGMLVQIERKPDEGVGLGRSYLNPLLVAPLLTPKRNSMPTSPPTRKSLPS